MSQENVAVVRNLYDAFGRGDVPTVIGLMDPQIVWNEAENFPLADRNPYVGPEAILTGVFARLAADWHDFAAVPEEFLDAGDTVVVLGHYHGTHKLTGLSQRSQIAHIWRVKDGKAAQFQQYVDTLQVARVTGAV
jgi:hypothetical protein